MVRVLGLARVQRLDHLLAARAERLRRAIEIEAVAGLVLHLGEQDRLAPQRRRARDPIALGQHADDLAVRMLRDLPRQRPAIGLGHPVLGLDELVGRDPRLERLEELGVLEVLDLRRLLKLGRVHGARCSSVGLNVQIVDDRSAERARIAGEFRDWPAIASADGHARHPARPSRRDLRRLRRSASRLPAHLVEEDDRRLRGDASRWFAPLQT